MRHDHTSWLIHFVRDRVPDQDHYLPESESDDNLDVCGELEPDAPAFAVLRTIIDLGGLISGYSIRSGRTTIYGGKPVVCVTEMPLLSFAEYAKAREDSSKVSAYGVAFLKSEFFQAGGRPVIYGLSAEFTHYERNDNLCRIIDPALLPLDEQFRYVSYNPVEPKWIDWSHEREWRWKARSEDVDYVWTRCSDGSTGPLPGLPLFSGADHGASFSKIGIIVWTETEARQIQRQLTGLYFAGSNDYDTPFARDVIAESFIITLENVVAAYHAGRLESQTIEGLNAAELLEPVLLVAPPDGARERIEAALASAVSIGAAAANEYATRYSLHAGACGYAHAATHDITNGLVQYMLQHGYAHGPYDGVVRIRVAGPWPVSQSIDYHEYVYDAVARELSARLGVEFYMRSRLD